jgi:hypothetical protein
MTKCFLGDAIAYGKSNGCPQVYEREKCDAEEYIREDVYAEHQEQQDYLDRDRCGKHGKQEASSHL